MSKNNKVKVVRPKAKPAPYTPSKTAEKPTTSQKDKQNAEKKQKTTQQQVAQAQYTQQEVEQIVDEIVAMPKPKRIWEVDFFRGLMILFVVWDHWMWDFMEFGPYKSDFFNKVFEFSKLYERGVLRSVAQPVFVSLFVLTSGISCSFSRSNGKRAIKMSVFALLITGGSYVASVILQTNVTIYFNVIHVITLSVICWTLIEWIWSKCKKPWQKNIFGMVMFAVIVASLVVGACALQPDGAWANDNPIWYFLARHKRTEGYRKFMGVDSLPFLPDFGWFLIGAFLGKFLYKKRETLFPSVNAKYLGFFTWCGRYSIWVYFGSQFLMYGILYMIAGYWKLL